MLTFTHVWETRLLLIVEDIKIYSMAGECGCTLAYRDFLGRKSQHNYNTASRIECVLRLPLAWGKHGQNNWLEAEILNPAAPSSAQFYNARFCSGAKAPNLVHFVNMSKSIGQNSIIKSVRLLHQFCRMLSTASTVQNLFPHLELLLSLCDSCTSSVECLLQLRPYKISFPVENCGMRAKF